MNIVEINPLPNKTLSIVSDDGRSGIFDVKPYLECEAFSDLKNESEFIKVTNFKYFIEWECGADLSADTIEAHMKTPEGKSMPSSLRQWLGAGT